jgi:hypothetical protein
MKKLLFSLTITIFAVAYLTGCKQDPSSSMNSMPMSANTTSNAHPAWTFTSSTIIKHSTYYTVAVSDSDATNNTNVYTSSVALKSITSPTWSANGGSISFIETGTSTIRAVDVTVSGGVPKGSNARTIYTAASGMTLSHQAWCPNSTNAKIAFVAKTSTGYGVYTISTSGGTATEVYSAASGDAIGAISWSNDGTQLALAYKTGTTLVIKVIDASTGAESATLASGSGYLNIGTLAWSHSGSNTLAFAATKVSGGNVQDYKIYTIAPTSGSTETLLITGYNASWSPDNSELVYSDDSNPPAVNRKVTVGNGGTSGVIGSYDISIIDWKQP